MERRGGDDDDGLSVFGRSELRGLWSRIRTRVRAGAPVFGGLGARRLRAGPHPARMPASRADKIRALPMGRPGGRRGRIQHRAFPTTPPPSSDACVGHFRPAVWMYGCMDGVSGGGREGLVGRRVGSWGGAREDGRRGDRAEKPTTRPDPGERNLRPEQNQRKGIRARTDARSAEVLPGWGNSNRANLSLYFAIRLQ